MINFIVGLPPFTEIIYVVFNDPHAGSSGGVGAQHTDPTGDREAGECGGWLHAWRQPGDLPGETLTTSSSPLRPLPHSGNVPSLLWDTLRCPLVLLRLGVRQTPYLFTNFVIFC